MIGTLPAAFIVPGADGIAPIHWLCAAAPPAGAALDDLLDALPAAAACADGRGCLALHWLAANDAAGGAKTLEETREGRGEDSGQSRVARGRRSGPTAGHFPASGNIGGGLGDAPRTPGAR